MFFRKGRIKMSSINKKKSFWLLIALFSLIGQVAWIVENMYFNVFIYNMFGATPGQISFMVGASSVVATLTTVFIGALSDKLGKRKVFISAGYILWGISILGFALVREDIIGGIFTTASSVGAVCVTVTIILDCVMTFFGSSANDACYNAWLTDITDKTNRGAVEGINSMMPLMAMLVVFGGFMSFDLKLASSWTAIFIIIGAVVLGVGVISIFTIQESAQKHTENSAYFKNIIYGFTPSVIKSNITLYLVILALALFGISIQIFMPYLIIYYEVSLGMTDYVFVMAPAIIIAGVFTAVYGRVYDKIGFGKSIILPICLLLAGYVMMGIFEQKALVFIGSLAIMCGYLSGMAVLGAMIRDFTPEGKAGAFQGLRIVGQVLIPGIIGPAIGAAVLKNADYIIGSDGTRSFVPNQSIFWAALVALIPTVLIVLITSMHIAKKNKT